MNPPNQPAAEQPPNPDDSILKTNIVNDIPMHAPNAPATSAPGEDADLDKIMQDVGQELEKNVQRPKKHHLFSKQPKPPKDVKAKPAAHTAPAAFHDVQPPTTPAPSHHSQSQPRVDSKAPPPKPKVKHSVPIFIILVTVIITGALVVAAMAAYKK